MVEWWPTEAEPPATAAAVEPPEEPAPAEASAALVPPVAEEPALAEAGETAGATQEGLQSQDLLPGWSYEEVEMVDGNADSGTEAEVAGSLAAEGAESLAAELDQSPASSLPELGQYWPTASDMKAVEDHRERARLMRAHGQQLFLDRILARKRRLEQEDPPTTGGGCPSRRVAQRLAGTDDDHGGDYPDGESTEQDGDQQVEELPDNDEVFEDPAPEAPQALALTADVPQPRPLLMPLRAKPCPIVPRRPTPPPGPPPPRMVIQAALARLIQVRRPPSQGDGKQR